MATILFTALAQGSGWNAFWVGVATMAGSYVDQNYLFPQKIEGAKMSGLQIQTSTYGKSIGKIYGGAARVAGNIMWGTKYVEHKKTSRQGGKGGGAKVTTYTYSVSFAVAIGKGPINRIKRVWADGAAFPLYESKYVVTGEYKNKLTFASVDSQTTSTWTLTAKNVDSSQVLGVKDSSGIEYADAHFGTYYSNGFVSFIIDKKSTEDTILDGATFILKVEPHTAKHEFTIHSGTEDQLPDSYMESIEGTGNVPAYRGLAYIIFKDIYTDDFGRRIPNFTFEIEIERNGLSEVIKEITVESGLEQSDIDTTDLEGITVNGYSVERASSGRDKIEPLMLTHLFDGVERDGKIYFRQRHAENALIIPYEDMGAYETERTEPLKITITDELELPRSVTVKYVSPDFDYQDQTISSKRQLTSGKTESSIDSGLVMTDSQAQELADTKLYEAWINRTAYETVLGSKYADVLPGDVLKLEDELGNLYPCIVAQSSFGKPGLNKISAVAIAGTIYERVERVIDPSTVLGEGDAATQVYFEFIDIPKLPGDTSATDSIYFAATGQVYAGVNIFKTSDDGSTYDLLQQHTANAIMGYAITELAAGAEHFWDNKNTIDIVLINGTLESRPEIDVLNGYNAAVIGNEIVQFTTATLLNTDTYRLSGLLRGRLGTESKISQHAINERFVLLTSNTLGKITSNSSDWYTARQYRIGPTTQSVDDLTYTNTTFTDNATMSKPFAPCHVEGVRNSNGDITLTWMRRTRYDGEWKDLSDAPLNETSEKYEVDIMSGSTVKRTIAVTAKIATYPVANQITDFGSVQSNITVRIYQISETRGRGTVREEII
ncbi:phage tail protein [Pelosinus sp. UFO1]|uniref:phage tail protein n=1 Tax=Pelosinus sp. UFO1 TaxID=484770 RepID=UPI0004D0ECBC|nr:phage tail protein [Pelosinus sp. UFO1]AIF51997.1 hypothetical protein UFO1_2450 [Pelosinus sp. UFO1]